MFRTVAARENGEATVLEYAWDTGWCDPCSADPITREEMRKLGVFWLHDRINSPQELQRRGWTPLAANPPDVFVTRLRVRYDAAHFPEDLHFQETGDRESFQGTYAIRHPWFGKSSCDALADYYRKLPERDEAQAQTLTRLTGWDLDEVRKRAGYTVVEMKPAGAQKRTHKALAEKEPWWRGSGKSCAGTSPDRGQLPIGPINFSASSLR